MQAELGLADSHRESHCRRQLVHLGSYWDFLHKQHQKVHNSACSFSQFSLFCCVLQWNLKVEVHGPQELWGCHRNWEVTRAGRQMREAGELWDVVDHLQKEQWEKLQHGNHSQGGGWEVMTWRRRHDIRKADLETIWSQMCSDTFAKTSSVSRCLTMSRSTQGFLSICYIQS